MKANRTKRIFILSVALVVVAAIAFVCTLSLNRGTDEAIPASSEPNYDYGYYTFDREMVLDSGETVRFYESGDETFSYSHDKDGYVLIRDNEALTLEYAVNDGGKPVTSGVSYAAASSRIATVPKMTLLDIDLEAHPELLTEYPEAEAITTYPPLAGNSGTLANLVIFIRFQGEVFTPSAILSDMFNAQSGSLKSYYRTMSNGSVNIDSVFPYEGGNIYVYTAENSRSYYNTNGNDRQRKEAALITDAVTKAKSKFNLIGRNLDVNGDGYLDSLSIIVNGDSSSTWGSLLWPHSWNLDAIDGNSSSTIDSEGRVKVGNYSFNFASALNVGVMCHEMGHVLGAPDLYHYNYDFVPVGNWDLMQFNNDTPQYMLTYMREKYIGGIGSEQIEEITRNGIYTLAPVSSADASTVLAYKIRTSRNEYFMVEYRRITASGFDSTLPGSGLIVYRVKEPADFNSSEGNQNATYKGTGSKADEVYIFRPAVMMTGFESSTSVIYSRSKQDIDYGYLSPSNAKFHTLGTTNVGTAYSPSNIFFSDGTNSGIVINAREISKDRIEFSVKVAAFESTDNNYFKDKISLADVSLSNNAEFAGVTAEITFGEIESARLNSLTAELKDADGKTIAVNNLKHSEFITAYKGGARSFISKFVYSDKGNVVNCIFRCGAFTDTSEPYKVVLKAVDSDGDEIALGEKRVNAAGLSWSTILNTKTEMQASIDASEKITVAVTRSGTVEVSGYGTAGQWGARGESNAVDVAAGYTHTLVLFNSLQVRSYGSNSYGEGGVGNWSDIKSVAAGKYTSYGLKVDGTVVACGLNDYGQCAVNGWSDIVAIAAGETHAVGLKADGSLVAAGNAANGATAVEDIRGAVAVAAGSGFTAVLLEDGSVVVRGYFATAGIDNWRVRKIAAGVNHLLGLNNDGTVVAAGDNGYGQCFTSGLIDVIDIAGGLKHSVFLRQDGVVEFRGSANPEDAVDVNVGNLLYASYTPVSKIERVTVNGVAASDNKFVIGLGETAAISVGYSPSQALYYRMNFVSSDESVIKPTVLSYTTASVKGNKEGFAYVTVSAHGTNVAPVRITIEVRRSYALTGIEFKDSLRSIPEGQSMRIAAVAVPAGAEYTGNVSYSSSNPSVISVNEFGVLTALGSAGASVTITATLSSYTAECTVTIVSDSAVTLSVITIDGTLKYRYGAALDLTNYLLRVTIGGSSEDIHIDEGMISGYDPYDITTLNQAVTVSYLGKTATFNATVRDYATSLVITESPKSNYLYGEALSGASGSLTVNKASGNTLGGVSFISTNYVGYDPYAVGMQVVSYVYTDPDWGDKISIDIILGVSDYAVDIEYVPVKSTYLYGEVFGNNETAELVMASGRRRAVAISSCEVADRDTEASEGEDYYALNSLRIGVHTLNVTYFEEFTNTELCCSASINVTVLGEITISGTTSETDENTYFYEQGGSLGLTVMVVQSTGAVEVLTSGNLVYALREADSSAFDSDIVTKREVRFSVSVAKQEVLTGGDISIVMQEIYNAIIWVEGVKPISSIAFMSGQPTVYRYGESIELKLKVNYENGDVGENVIAHEALYDNTAIGAVTYTALYFGHTVSVELEINDFCEGLLPIEDVTLSYEAGGYYFPEVYAVMAYARNVKLEYSSVSGYTIAGNRLDVLGTRTVTVGYMNGGEEFSTTFTLTVKDVFVSITCVTPPKTQYKKGESFNPASSYRLIMRSGDKGIIEYNGDDFEYSPELGNIEVGGVAYVPVSIYYKNGSSRELAWRGNCSVPNYVERLEVVKSMSKFEYKYGESLSVTLRAYLADGSDRQINSYRSDDYDSRKIGKQTVTLSYTYPDNGETYVTTIEITVEDEIVSVRVNAPNVTTYGYGDALRWIGGRATVTYRSGGTVVYNGDEIKENVNVEYNTLSEGKRKVVVGLGDASDYFYITVTSASVALITVPKENIDVSDNKREVVAKESVSSEEIIGCFPKYAQYLILTYQDAAGVTVTSARGVRSGDKVVLSNADGIAAFTYTIYLKGDMNGDGEINKADVEELAGAIASPDSVGVAGDEDENGKVNLTDLVKLARRVSGGPAPAPLNDSARAFITDVTYKKGKEEGEYE